jgi:hypothetical protein
MKEKIGSNENECFQYHPPKKISESDREKKRTETELKHLDEKIVGIVHFLSDFNLEKAEKAGVEQASIRKLVIIKENLSELISLMDDPEMKIVMGSHLSDRLGNFQGCLSMAETIIRKKKEENISGKLITMFEDQITRYHNYFSECLTKETFLKKELATREGVEMH